MIADEQIDEIAGMQDRHIARGGQFHGCGHQTWPQADCQAAAGQTGGRDRLAGAQRVAEAATRHLPGAFGRGRRPDRHGPRDGTHIGRRQQAASGQIVCGDHDVAVGSASGSDGPRRDSTASGEDQAAEGRKAAGPAGQPVGEETQRRHGRRLSIATNPGQHSRSICGQRQRLWMSDRKRQAEDLAGALEDELSDEDVEDFEEEGEADDGDSDVVELPDDSPDGFDSVLADVLADSPSPPADSPLPPFAAARLSLR